jgi:hypothetical protein
VVDRGWPLAGVTDWGTMEIFGTRVVTSDPFRVAESLAAGVCAADQQRQKAPQH